MQIFVTVCFLVAKFETSDITPRKMICTPQMHSVCRLWLEAIVAAFEGGDLSILRRPLDIPHLSASQGRDFVMSRVLIAAGRIVNFVNSKALVVESRRLPASIDPKRAFIVAMLEWIDAG